jgi:integrase
MKVSIGILLVTIPYSYQRGKVIYYQRAIPADLQERCAAKRVKVKLDTENLRLAAKQIESLNREVEAGWKAMRVSPDVVPKTIKMKAADLLRDWDLSPDSLSHDDDATSLFHSHLDLKRERYAMGNESAYRHADPSDYLQPHEIVAAQMLAGQSKPRLSDALDLYLKFHAKRNVDKFCKYARTSFGRMVAAIGDKVIEDTSREDGHAFVTKMQAEGLSTGSVRRLLNTSIAVMEAYIKEKQISRTNPFSSIPIPDEGVDVEGAIPYATEELDKLVNACMLADDDRRWLLAMIADTGARLAEVAGLAIEDIHLDDPVPHIVIKVHPWRSLKNKASARAVPLLGASLWAAQRVMANAPAGQALAFPRYNKTAKTNANSASAALNKWIKDTLELDHIIHELRHTIADRLREVQCPADVRLAIGGWTVGGVGEGYGQGYTLRVMAEWLAKVISPLPMQLHPHRVA